MRTCTGPTRPRCASRSTSRSSPPAGRCCCSPPAGRTPAARRSRPWPPAPSARQITLGPLPASAEQTLADVAHRPGPRAAQRRQPRGSRGRPRQRRRQPAVPRGAADLAARDAGPWSARTAPGGCASRPARSCPRCSSGWSGPGWTGSAPPPTRRSAPPPCSARVHRRAAGRDARHPAGRARAGP